MTFYSAKYDMKEKSPFVQDRAMAVQVLCLVWTRCCLQGSSFFKTVGHHEQGHMVPILRKYPFVQ
jgi:hypothetical protein